MGDTATMHMNSLASYSIIRQSLGEREAAVLGAVKLLGICTDRQVMEWLGFADPNQVRPRVTQLVQRGYLREVGSQEDHVTGRKVRLVECAL